MVCAQRERAWERYKYPCIGQWQFLNSRTPYLPTYRDIVARVRAGASILDLGCCFGQDLRILAAEGLSTQNMYASDIIPEFWELSYDLFCDRSTMQAHMLQADIFDPASELKTLHGSIDIVLTTHFFHLFSYEQQVEASKSIIAMCRPGAMIVGFNIGTKKAKNVPAGETKGSASASAKYYHDEASFIKMWLQIEQETGTTWKVDAALCPLDDWDMPREDFEWMGPDARGLSFSVTRQS